MAENDPQQASKLAVVVGASGGIGGALATELLTRGEADHVVGLSRERAWNNDAQRTWIGVDLQDEATIEAAATQISNTGLPTIVLVASGALHGPGLFPEKTYRAMSQEALATIFSVNTIGPAIIAKHLLPLMPRRGRSVFAALSARVGSIGDNRLGGWYGYRSSKAALNMLVHSLSIEHRRTHPEAICVALHPGTVRTDLSEPFAPKGDAGLRVLSPAQSANGLINVLSRLTPAHSGGFFDSNGKPIPW